MLNIFVDELGSSLIHASVDNDVVGNDEIGTASQEEDSGAVLHPRAVMQSEWRRQEV